VIRFPFRFALLATGLLALAAFGGHATAQKEPVPSPKTQPTDTDKGKKSPGRMLTYETLPEILDSMGYEFKTDTYKDGSATYWVTIKNENWTFVIGVTLSINKAWVWYNAPLRKIPEGAPGEPLMRLLQKNWSITPDVFAATPDRFLYLQRTFENQNITPAKLRAAFDSMTGHIRSSADLWNVEKWGQTPTPEPKGGNGGPVAAAYPDTPEGLTKLCKETLALAKAGKRAEVATKVKGFVIPNADAWFKRTFGPETGAAMSEEYATGQTQMEASLARSFMTAAEEGQTDVRVFKFIQPDQEGVTATQKKIMNAMAVKTPLYSVYFTQPGEDTGMHLYSFVYVNGNFRMAGKMKAATARTVGFRPNGDEKPNGNGKPENAIPFPLFSGARPVAPPPAFNSPAATPVNELNPENFRHLTPLLPPGVANMNAPGSAPAKKFAAVDEPSIVGVWKGELTMGPQRWTVTTTFRANGNYKSVMVYANYVLADHGTYKYADGVLKTEPEGGRPGTFTVTFVDDNTMKLVGEGLSITYKRQ
jgi:hypothetical protein